MDMQNNCAENVSTFKYSHFFGINVQFLGCGWMTNVIIILVSRPLGAVVPIRMVVGSQLDEDLTDVSSFLRSA